MSVARKVATPVSASLQARGWIPAIRRWSLHRASTRCPMASRSASMAGAYTDPVDALGAGVGASVGAAVGVTVGATLGVAVGATLGVAVGAAVGVAVGAAVGVAVGKGDGVEVGLGLGEAHRPLRGFGERSR